MWVEADPGRNLDKCMFIEPSLSHVLTRSIDGSHDSRDISPKWRMDICPHKLNRNVIGPLHTVFPENGFFNLIQMEVWEYFCA